MKQFEDAKNLIKNSKEKLDKIITLHDSSLSKKTIEPDLLIEVKNFTENLRSALDFSARGIFIKYGSSPKVNPKIYFPYTKIGDTKKQFIKNFNYAMPGVFVVRPDIFSKLESYQPFLGVDNNWLSLFMDLNNKNKHVELIPHVFEKKRGMKINGKQFTLITPKLIVRSGASVEIGGRQLPVGEYNAENLPDLAKPFSAEVVIWDSIHFSSNGEKVIPFLKKALERIGPMVENMEAL